MNSKKNNLNNSEIDLVNIIFTIWNNRLKIFLITFVSVITVLSYLSITKSKEKPKYIVKVNIAPISNFESFSYQAFNSYIDNAFITINEKTEQKLRTTKNLSDRSDLDLKKIEKNLLLEFFLTSINDISFLSNSLKEFNFFEQKDYENSFLYEKAVKNIATSIKFLAPEEKNSNENNNNIQNGYWQIIITTENISKWQEFLKKINKLANIKSREYLEQYYKQVFTNNKNLRKFNIEDIETNITNALENYEVEISRKIIYLKEQALIARKLNIPNASSTNISSGRGEVFITSLSGELPFSIKPPYYMRGYEVIEKEIELIEKRNNNRAFAENVGKLEKKKKDLISNKNIERLETLFDNTPIKKDKDNFTAANILYDRLLVESINSGNELSLKKITILTLIISFILSIFYILIINSIKKRY